MDALAACNQQPPQANPANWVVAQNCTISSLFIQVWGTHIKKKPFLAVGKQTNKSRDKNRRKIRIDCKTEWRPAPDPAA